ncbi:MAG: outer membrane beta-barrel protein, partial [Candidatus Brocadiales bacterium]
ANWSGSAENVEDSGHTPRKTSEAWGVAQYITYQHTDRLGFALRGEYFWDHDNFAGLSGADGGASLAEVTFTTNLLLREKLWIRPEIRYDKILHVTRASADAWDVDADVDPGHDANLTFAIATTYEF